MLNDEITTVFLGVAGILRQQSDALASDLGVRGGDKGGRKQKQSRCPEILSNSVVSY